MKKGLKLLLSAAFALSIAGCANGSSNDDKTIKIGATAIPHAEILNDVVKDELEKEGYTLEVTEFTDYVTPNTSLEDGDLDANYFQTLAYLKEQNKERKLHLKAVAGIHYEAMALYSEKVMDHFTNPRNVGKIEDADGVGEVGNAKCGDIMKMYIKVSDDGIIEDVKFNTFGCASAIASSSMATEMIKGQPIDKALELTNKAVVEALDGLPPVKIHCSVLAEEAVKAAVKDYYDKKGIEYDHAKFASVDCAECGVHN